MRVFKCVCLLIRVKGRRDNFFFVFRFKITCCDGNSQFLEELIGQTLVFWF
jgi:hypothetical protein